MSSEHTTEQTTEQTTAQTTEQRVMILSSELSGIARMVQDAARALDERADKHGRAQVARLMRHQATALWAIHASLAGIDGVIGPGSIASEAHDSAPLPGDFWQEGAHCRLKGTNVRGTVKEVDTQRMLIRVEWRSPYKKLTNESWFSPNELEAAM